MEKWLIKRCQTKASSPPLPFPSDEARTVWDFCNSTDDHIFVCFHLLCICFHFIPKQIWLKRRFKVAATGVLGNAHWLSFGSNGFCISFFSLSYSLFFFKIIIRVVFFAGREESKWKAILFSLKCHKHSNGSGKHESGQNDVINYKNSQTDSFGKITNALINLIDHWLCLLSMIDVVQLINDKIKWMRMIQIFIIN